MRVGLKNMVSIPVSAYQQTLPGLWVREPQVNISERHTRRTEEHRKDKEKQIWVFDFTGFEGL